MREPARSFLDLMVWQKAHAFVLLVYAATQAFPKAELYGLTAQFRRAAVSIPANIAEGFRKQSDADKRLSQNGSEQDGAGLGSKGKAACCRRIQTYDGSRPTRTLLSRTS